MSAPDFTQRPLVYVAGPFSSDPLVGTRSAIDTADTLITLGACPVVPHLSLLWDLRTPRPAEWWYAYDLGLLARCDALYRLPGVSVGADREEEWAHAKGIPVLTDRDQVVGLVAGWSP